MPPQKSGKGTSPFENFSFIFWNCISKSERDEIIELWCETHAPSLLPSGLDKK